MGEDCGRDCVRLAGIVGVGEQSQGICFITLGQPVEDSAVDSISWCYGRMELSQTGSGQCTEPNK
jgi:hypothetical protein